MRLTIRASKTDQEHAGTTIGVPFGAEPDSCPVRALRVWLSHLDDDRPALFRRMSRWGMPTRARLTAQSVALVL